jgi:thiol-disulfide isomerase/thioredoxin
LILASNCKSNLNSFTEDEVETPHFRNQGKIVLENKSGKEINLSYLDKFSDFIQIKINPDELYTIDSDTTVCLNNTHYKYGATYILRPGDSVKVVFDSIGMIKMTPYALNIERKNEIDLFRFINAAFNKSYHELIFESITNDQPITRFFKLKKNLENRFNQEKEILNKYSTTNKISNEFYECAKSIIELEFYSKQFIGLWNNKIFAESVVGFKKSFDSAYLQLQNKYLDNTCTPILYKNVKYSYYIRNANYLFNQNPFNNYMPNEAFLDTLYSFTKRRLSNSEKTNQYLFLIVKEALLKQPLIKSNSIKLFFNDCKDSNYTEYIKDMLSIKDIKKTKSSESILISVDNNQTGFDAVIEKLKGSIIYIDIWASWCIPCRNEFPYTLKLREAFKDKAVKFVYISIDNNYNMWKKAVNFEKINDYDLSFLLLDFEKSEFKKRFNIGPIPRYIIIDKKGKLFLSDAPRPSETETTTLLNNLLNKIIETK